MVIRGFAKHLQRGTISDDEIRESLVWVRAMVDGVLLDQAAIVADTNELVSEHTD